MDLKTFQDRLVQSMDKKRLKQVDLVKATGVSKGTVSNWVSGKTSPDDAVTLGKLARALGVSIDWLVTGRSGDNFKQANSIDVRMAPVLNYVQAGAFEDYFDDAIVDRYEPVIGSHSISSYWVVIEGLSMIPDYKPGDLVLIDPDIQPNPGDCVIAVTNGKKQTTFKKWRPRGFDEDTGKQYFEFVASNDVFTFIDSRYVEFYICGVAVSHNKQLR